MQRSIGILLVCTILFSYQNCGEQINEPSRVRIRMPEQLPSEKIHSSFGWGQQSAPVSALGDIWFTNFEPGSTSDLNCFGVMIGGGEENLQTNQCLDNQTGKIVSFGPKRMGALPNEVIDIEVDSGSARTIRIIGWRAKSKAACQSLRNGSEADPAEVDVSSLSHPFVIGTLTLDLQPGNVSVDVTASLTGARKLLGCNIFKSNGSVQLAPGTFLAGGEVTGLKGPVLTNLGLGLSSGDNSTTTEIDGSGAGLFENFPIENGEEFTFSVAQQPSAHNCTIENATGTISNGNNTDAKFNCVGSGFTTSGTVTGLVGDGLRLGKHAIFVPEESSEESEVTEQATALSIPVLENLGVEQDGSFTFNGLSAPGEFVFVTVTNQPAGQTCSVPLSPVQVTDSNISGFEVTCETTFTPGTFLAGANVVGLSGPVLTNLEFSLGSGTSSTTVEIEGSGAGLVEGFPIENGEQFTFSITQQPSAHDCTLENATGTISNGNNTDAIFNCVGAGFTTGGTVTGLVGNGLRLGKHATLAVTAQVTVLSIPVLEELGIGRDGSFTFSGLSAPGEFVIVTVTNQPDGQTCSVPLSPVEITDSNVSSFEVTCVANAFSLGGSFSGVDGSVTLSNGLDRVTFSGSTGNFTFPTSVAEGQSYDVQVFSTNGDEGGELTCLVQNGTGTMGSANVTDVQVTCTLGFPQPTLFSISGTVSGLPSGASLSLGESFSETSPISVTANGSFNFGSIFPSGDSFLVSTLSVNLGETPGTLSCSVANASGTIGSSDITNVDVTCVHNVTLSIKVR